MSARVASFVEKIKGLLKDFEVPFADLFLGYFTKPCKVMLEVSGIM